LIAEQYQRAQNLLKENRQALERLTKKLLETETVDGAAVKQALEGLKIKEPLAA
jgi:ATP-dependent Zn protease